MTLPGNGWLPLYSKPANLRRPLDFYPEVPSNILALTHSVAYGPRDFLLNTINSIVERWYVAWHDPAQQTVYIAQYVNGVWSGAVAQFAEPNFVSRLSLSFDQSGKPLFFYQTAANELKLYWYDPTLGRNATVVVGEGNWPVIAMDMPHNTSNSITDVLLGYVKNDRVYWRAQRDRFLTEYDTGLTRPNIILHSMGARVDHRMQIGYSVPN